ncbi:MAG: caspase family protein [Bacteroidota bacterium]
MKNLYALLVGINDYPVASHKLNGCINDRDAIHDFFNRYAELNDLNYQPLLLSDQTATRQGIINGFDHFQNAQDNDLCVFYYSGHGSQMVAPQEFWKDETDRRCETVVCYDSRIGQGRDLSDKELSYLLWKASQGKTVHFLAIFDCCHAGSITRDVEVRHRMAEVNTTPVFAKEFEGVATYKSQAGQLIPPESDHVTLSASRSYESSVEVTLGGKKRGLFTYSLIDVLNQSELSTMSYAGLMSKVQTRVHNRIGSQHPEANAQGKASVDQIFLNGSLWVDPSFVVKFNEQKGWIIDLGHLHGMNAAVTLTAEDNGAMKTLAIKNIETAESVIKTEDWMQPAKKFYYVRAIAGLNKKVNISFFPQLQNEQAKQYIREMVKDWNIEYVDDHTAADYWMRLRDDDGYILTLPHQERPLFKAIPESTGNPSEGLTSAEVLFLKNVNKVARWKEVSELSNPLASGAAAQELDIQFFQVNEHVDYLAVKEETPMDTDGDAVFHYAFKDGVWEKPSLRLSIKNIGDRPLWVTTLFLGEDFVVTDYFMPVKEIRPGDEAYPLQAVDQNGYKVNIIPIHVPDEIHSWGETEISNQLKIIASATPFSVEAFRQTGLELEAKPTTRGAKSRGMGFGPPSPPPTIPTQPTWFTKDIVYKIHRPQDVVNSSAGKTIQLHELTIEGHDSFTAEAVHLSSSSNVTRSVGRPAIQDFLGSDNFQPINIQRNTRNVTHGLDTIELHNVRGKENVNADNPLKIRMHNTLAANEKIFPFGYDPETKTYYPLGHPDEAEDFIRVEELPDADEIVTRGLGRSLKIYLQKVVYQKIFKKEFHFPILAVATVDEQHEVTYENNYDVIKSKVQNPDNQRIIIFIHGIISDCKDQIKLMRRAVLHQHGVRQDLTDIYDLALTFDYESLNDPIETTAQNLKKRLERIGLGAGHSKTVHLIAHSMGGLVSRWFIEKLGGDQLVSHFIQVGSPNAGSPWANTYHMGMFGITKLINFLPIPSTINSMLAYIGKKRKKVEVTVTQLQPHSEFLQKLNAEDGKSNIPYTIVAGDSTLIPTRHKSEPKLFRRMLNRYASEYRQKLLKLFFHDRSDDIVAVASCHGIPPNKCHQLQVIESVGCNHFTYFNTDEGVEQLAEILFEIKNLE